MKVVVTLCQPFQGQSPARSHRSAHVMVLPGIVNCGRSIAVQHLFFRIPTHSKHCSFWFAWKATGGCHVSLAMIWSTRLLALAIFTAADWVENSDEDLVDLRLLQISNVLHLSDRTKITSLRPQPWNFTQILQDQPNGSFLSHLDVLVRMIGVTYNTTRPLSGVHQTPSTLTARDSQSHTALTKSLVDAVNEDLTSLTMIRIFHQWSL